jgi:hypothetical protein
MRSRWVCDFPQIPFIIGFQFVDWSGLNGMNTFIDVYFITGTHCLELPAAVATQRLTPHLLYRLAAQIWS